MASSQFDDSKDRVGYLFHDVNTWELKPADHIYVWRAFGAYSHHGIYTGESGQEVIHFAGAPGRWKSKSTARIRAATVAEFCDDGTLRLVAYDVNPITYYVKRSSTTHYKKSRPADAVLFTAKRYLRNPDTWGDYNLLFNNCESFAVYCKTGLPISEQVINTPPLATLYGIHERIAEMGSGIARMGSAIAEIGSGIADTAKGIIGATYQDAVDLASNIL